MHLINKFDEKTIVLERFFSGEWCWNGPCLGPTGNCKMCKKNASVLRLPSTVGGQFCRKVLPRLKFHPFNVSVSIFFIQNR